jgi:cysteine desulfurase
MLSALCDCLAGKMRRIYLDHNATTPIHPEAIEAMLPFLREDFGNPSSVHAFGQAAKKGLEEAREAVARLIGAQPEEIVFTGSGTEASNLAIKGVVYARGGGHVITSSIEHPAVLNVCRQIEREGFRVTYLPVDRTGSIEPDDVRRAMTEETILVTLMHANNEVGTIQPIEEAARVARERGVLFHTDAVQSAGKIPVDVDGLGADLLSFSAHKVYGPKGVGALFVRRGTSLRALIHGGHQEQDRRAGTENVAGIVGFGRAAGLASRMVTAKQEELQSLRDYFWKKIQQEIEDVHLNGDLSRGLPNTLSAGFDYIDGESLLINLDLQGVAASAGSACTSGALEPSHVLVAMGVAPETARGTLRFSLGRESTNEEIDETVSLLTDTVKRLRSMSPLYLDGKKRRR